MKDPTFTKIDLQIIYRNLSRVLPPGGQPLTDPAEIVLVNGVLAKATAMIATSLPTLERGHLVLAWRIHPDLAPTMNELSNWNARQRWKPGKAKARLQDEIRKLIEVNPILDLCGAQKQRWLRITRFTNAARNIDDPAADQIGGKLPIDMLTKMGVFVNDSPRWLIREASVRSTTRGNLHVLIEVCECADEQVHGADPEDGPAPPSPWEKRSGATTKHIDGDAPALAPIAKPKPRARREKGEKSSLAGWADIIAGEPRKLPFGDDS